MPGWCMDNTWTYETRKTINAESYKRCKECADRIPKRSIEEVSSGSAEPLHTRGRQKWRRQRSIGKKKAKEGSIIAEEMEGRVESETWKRKIPGERKKKNRGENCTKKEARRAETFIRH